MSIIMRIPIKTYLAISDNEVAELERAQDEMQFNVSNYEAIIADIQGVAVSIHEPVTVDTIIL